MKGLVISRELLGEKEVKTIEPKGIETDIIPQSCKREESSSVEGS